ncbi:hypothetical protein BK121_27815 [Paenibacillus odorifer]|uniref:hypothetical protein n=1 Tax=Paenibacillus odorifer TaxID=189426 RepID=UPI00096BD559|nr:hypothetical protein [Paenibacillus odorifer]OMC63333.1 hypothetical protein BK121_27815 [Paenibacillus odorifer]
MDISLEKYEPLIATLLKQINTNSKNKNQQGKMKEIENLLTTGQFIKIIEDYKVKFPQSIFDDNAVFLEYWINLTLDEKESFSLIELKIAYYLLTKTFDSRIKERKEQLLARIDELVSIRKRREELNKSSM